MDAQKCWQLHRREGGHRPQPQGAGDAAVNCFDGIACLTNRFQSRSRRGQERVPGVSEVNLPVLSVQKLSVQSALQGRDGRQLDGGA